MRTMLGSFRPLGRPLTSRVDAPLSSGIESFAAQGFEGWPIGRISALDGPPGSGKTRCALAAVAAAQRARLQVLYVDLEHALSVPLMTKTGVSLGLPVVRMTCPDDALQATLLALRRGALDLLVVDTLALARQPRRWLAQAVGLAARHRTAVLVLDQQRQRGPNVVSSASGLSLTHHAACHGRLRAGRQSNTLTWIKNPANPAGTLTLTPLSWGKGAVND
jgi:hypothetical protein